MPTERFLHLKPEKQQKICDVALKELNSNSYKDMSINRIIKQADISRGSFYTYFEDKHDLVIYLFKDKAREAGETVLKTVEDFHGNVFKAMLHLKAISDIRDVSSMIYKIRELMMDQDFINKSEKEEDVRPYKKEFEDFINRMYEIIDHELIPLSRMDFTGFFHLYMGIIFRSLMGEDKCTDEMREYMENITKSQVKIIYRGVTGDFKTNLLEEMRQEEGDRP